MQQQPVINPLGSPFIELSSVDSTNNYALSRVREGLAGHGSAFFTYEQTAGKGQMGRQWLSEKGANIALSVVIQPKPLQISQQFQLSACIAIAASSFLSKYAGEEIKIKWPNDLYWKSRKIGGILIENIISGASPTWHWAVAGTGININQTLFPPGLPNPVSLKQITGKSFDSKKLAEELCVILDKYFAQLISEGFENIYKEYNNCLYKLNEAVRLKKGNSVFRTTIIGVTAGGELITNNTIMEQRFLFGEIAWEI